jgi:hypothetical protein
LNKFGRGEYFVPVEEDEMVICRVVVTPLTGVSDCVAGDVIV